ncbi:hypothetical protein H8S10_17485 [Clostridium sp. NSJ-49]|uniref:Uncharacterized protein n=1 Tax=Clostridium disporicum TaxID=84024 RepID=A0A173ZHH6_9CLOT|nr:MULTISPECIES: hypothetical protein [Clostridium]MBC5627192.1 hypothetical protein [Clostridium sp. NSJ-49]MCD2503277.1 hypothetical protein [Clostridium sp. NSJ-145]MDU6339963.1 hypothetical protein [Clostridium sp.]CUN74668.1 Uncharacterised protein [Clostridium disporicum]
MNESTWYRIKYSIGYVFEENKLVIAIPVGILDSTKENFEKNIKLMDIGPYIALPSEAISIGESCRDNISRILNETLEDAIIIIDKIIDGKTGEDLEEICTKAKDMYDSEKIYLEKGYILKNIDEFNENIDQYNFE